MTQFKKFMMMFWALKSDTKKINTQIGLGQLSYIARSFPVTSLFGSTLWTYFICNWKYFVLWYNNIGWLDKCLSESDSNIFYADYSNTIIQSYVAHKATSLVNIWLVLWLDPKLFGSILQKYGNNFARLWNLLDDT